MQRSDALVDRIVAGELDHPSARLALKLDLKSMGYQPCAEDASTIKDWRTDAWLNLILDTGTSIALCHASWEWGQNPDVLLTWPAQELLRIESRKEPRNWPERWLGAGGKFFGGLMIARKDSPVWRKLGNARDGLGNPYPPFAFNSGMGVQDVPYCEALALGIIDDRAVIKPQSHRRNSFVNGPTPIRSAQINKLLRAQLELGCFDAGGRD
ncbi:MAG: hypothetical protein HY043_22735 [Verrucomicrobia bacterium]|nr:hypothetical protein [Verrucomicrobiota bacterium]